MLGANMPYPTIFRQDECETFINGRKPDGLHALKAPIAHCLIIPQYAPLLSLARSDRRILQNISFANE